MKPSKGWVWETADSKKFIVHYDAVSYSVEHGIDVNIIKKSRSQLWVVEDGTQFLEYQAAFDYEGSLEDIS